MKSAPSSSWPMALATSSSALAASTLWVTAAERAALGQPRPGGADVRVARPASRQRSRTPRLRARRRPTDGILDVRRPHVAGPADAGAGQEPAVALGDLEERGRVDPPTGRSSARRRAASRGCGRRPSRGRTSRRSHRRSRGRRPGPDPPSSSDGRIQRIVPSSTRMLTPTPSRSERPSARAPSRYRVRPVGEPDGAGVGRGRRGSSPPGCVPVRGLTLGRSAGADGPVAAPPRSAAATRSDGVARGERRGRRPEQEPASAERWNGLGLRHGRAHRDLRRERSTRLPSAHGPRLDRRRCRASSCSTARRRSSPCPASRPPSVARVEVWIKREDLLPLAFGGNKLRNLEFLVGAALAEGADTLVTRRPALVEPRPADGGRRREGRPRRPPRPDRAAARSRRTRTCASTSSSAPRSTSRPAADRDEREALVAAGRRPSSAETAAGRSSSPSAGPGRSVRPARSSRRSSSSSQAAARAPALDVVVVPVGDRRHSGGPARRPAARRQPGAGARRRGRPPGGGAAARHRGDARRAGRAVRSISSTRARSTIDDAELGRGLRPPDARPPTRPPGSLPGPRASSSTRSTPRRRSPGWSAGPAPGRSTGGGWSSGTPAARPGCSSRSTATQPPAPGIATSMLRAWASLEARSCRRGVGSTP